MKRVARRQVLASLGLFGGAGVMAGCSSSSRAPGGDQRVDSQSTSWTYVELAPERVGNEAYKLFPEGGCMYGVVGGIVTRLADRRGEPYRSFPLHMMRYGTGGAVEWGALCGALNGSAAVIGLVHARKQGSFQWPFGGFGKPEWYSLVDEVYAWYESAELPTYQPDNSAPIASSVAGSVLCHVSLNSWRECAGHKAFGSKKVERCRRLTADVARKTVEVLNEDLKNSAPSGQLSASVTSCRECHGKNGRGDSMGKMNCSACHELSDKHPDG